jgi:hypothetical protein
MLVMQIKSRKIIIVLLFIPLLCRPEIKELILRTFLLHHEYLKKQSKSKRAFQSKTQKRLKVFTTILAKDVQI